MGAYGYAAAGRYLADSVGAVHIAKREAEAEPEAEAEAEAEPQMFYNSYGSQGLFNTAFNTYRYPTVYSGYPRSFYQPSYNNFGYRNFYGKREADAEPEAEAEAFYMKGLYQTPYNTAYPTGYPTTSLRSYAAPVRSYPFGTVYSGYRTFIQPASQYYGRYYY